MVKVGIVEDIAKTRIRIKDKLELADDIEVSMLASNGKKALDKLDALAKEEIPDLILMDIALPGISGIDTTIIIKERYPDIFILMQTVFEDEQKIFKSIQAGASGYLLKDDRFEKYINAIQEVMEGGAPLSPCIARKVLNYVRSANQEDSEKKKKALKSFELTKRELEILALIVEDLTDAHIADKLYISPHTVRSHVKNIYKKLHVHSRASAVRIVLENNLLS